MKKLSILLTFVLGMAAMSLGLSGPANAQVNFSAADFASAPNCGRFPTGQSGYLCNCEAGFSLASVWGSGPFTGDSNICSAAAHAGAITSDGGVVFASSAAGQSSYVGSLSNGVTSANWGSYGSSFIVEAALQDTGAASCSTLPNGEESLTCSCDADTGNNGGVWGSGPYTADSNICAAARHAGYLDSGAGSVTVLRIPGLEKYSGSEWNGVTTADWGSYGSSIVFDGN